MYKIGIFSSSSREISNENKRLAIEIGKYLSEREIIVVSGGSSGIPGIVIESAYHSGAHTELYSPDKDEKTHNLRKDNHALNYYKIKRFIPGFTSRSLEMIRNIDGAIILNGRIGTLSEFTIALEEGLDIAVIKGTGGIADEIENIVKIANKEFSNRIFFGYDFRKAINDLLNHLNSKKH